MNLIAQALKAAADVPADQGIQLELLKKHGYQPDDQIWLPGEKVTLYARDATPEQLAKAKGRNLRDVIPAGKGRFSPGNKGTEEYLERVRSGQTCGIPSALYLQNSENSWDLTKPSVLCIAAGGPSLSDNLGELRHLIKRGAKLMAVNKTADWLLKRGIRCDYAVLLDPKDWVADYIDPTLKDSKAIRKMAGKYWADTKYLIASQCHDKTRDKFKGRKDAFIYHAGAGLGEKDLLRKEFPNEPWIYITGGSVVGLRAIPLGYGLGFREYHTFGLDGSSKAPPENEMRRVFQILKDIGRVEWKADREPTRDEMFHVLFSIFKGRIKLPEQANDILRKYLYSYSKPVIDATWSAFTVDLKTGWSRSYFSNHHMARSVYEFEDSMREWDQNIRNGMMEPFRIRVHGDPEQSAIAMVAAGMGIHYSDQENEKYGQPPRAKAA